MLKVLAVASLVVVGGAIAAGIHHAPSIAAGGILYPTRHVTRVATPSQCTEREFAGDGVALRGWACAALTARRGTVVYLHGIADNRGSALGAIQRYTAKGLDVIAYDGRRHGDSGGEFCTYGFYEKRDLARVLDQVPSEPVVVIGTSLGAAIALQAAAIDSRITAVVAAETFADLETVARERAPSILPESIIRAAFREADARAQFHVAEVSPVAAAARIRVPVLLIHGADDTATPPHHSHRVFAALTGPKQLILVPGAGHNQSLHRRETWAEVDAWIERILRGQS
jgi:uncharacterized protein